MRHGHTTTMAPTATMAPTRTGGDRRGQAPRARRLRGMSRLLLCSWLVGTLLLAGTASATPVTVTLGAGLLGANPLKPASGFASLDVVADGTQSQVCFSAGVRGGAGITRVTLYAGGTAVLQLAVTQVVRTRAGELAAGCTGAAEQLVGLILLSPSSYDVQVEATTLPGGVSFVRGTLQYPFD